MSEVIFFCLKSVLRYQKQLDKRSSSGIRLGFLEGSFSAFNNFCIFTSCALTVLYGSYCVYERRVEGGVIVMVGILFTEM